MTRFLILKLRLSTDAPLISNAPELRGSSRLLKVLMWETCFMAATYVTSGRSHPLMEVNQGSVPGDSDPLP